MADKAKTGAVNGAIGGGTGVLWVMVFKRPVILQKPYKVQWSKILPKLPKR